MKKALIYTLLICGIYSCKDVVNDIPQSAFGTTPYSFDEDHLLTLPPVRIASDNPLTKEGVQLGRMLFYDPILSADSTQSCASCHNQANAFTDNGKQFSTGIKGQQGTRNSMGVFNLMWHLDGFFWDGRSDVLRHLALVPIEDPLEMDETIGNVLVKLSQSPMYQEEFKKAFNTSTVDEDLLGKALEQFMLSIVSGNSKYDRVKLGLETFTDEEAVGEIIFNAEAIPLSQELNPSKPANFGADCFHCHGTGNGLFMRREFLSNGLPSNGDLGRGGANGNVADNYKFKTPSLRNIEHTAPYMHDGRFNTLEEVVQFYLSDMKSTSAVNPNDAPNLHSLKDSIYLSPAHKAALVSFLKTLTDDELLTKEEYSNPF